MNMRRPIAVVLAALLLPTGTIFRHQFRAQDKPDVNRWEKAIAAFEKQDQDKAPPKNAVLFVGSSSIRMWDLARSFPGVETINRGFGGSQLADSVHFAPRIVVKHQPRLVVLYAGDNDIAAGKTPEQVFADFKAFVQVVHKDLPKTRIAYLSIKASVKRWALADKIRQANNLIEGLCKQDDRLIYIDTFKPMLGDNGQPRPELFLKDGLHLNDQGYEIWAALVKPHLAEKKEMCLAGDGKAMMPVVIAAKASDATKKLADWELAASHAAFRFLEEIGCRWFFPAPEWTVLPTRPTLNVRVNLSDRPALLLQ